MVGTFGTIASEGSVRRRRSSTRPVARVVESLEGRTLFAGGPSVSIDAPDLTAGGGTTHEVVVTYTDPDSVNIASIDPKDLAVTGPTGQALMVLGVSITPSANAQQVTARYVVGAPGGVFDPGDNGDYTVSLPAAAVADVSGEPSAAASAVFSVNMIGVELPLEAVIDARDLAVEGAATHSIRVVFTALRGVDLTTVDPGDLVVTSPQGVPLTVTAANPGQTGPGVNVLTVTYVVAGPGGMFDLADQGMYSVALLPGAVKDVAGDAFPAATAQFAVVVPPDVESPRATFGAVHFEAGTRAGTVQVNYADVYGLDEATVDASDITVTGPGGPLVISGATAAPAAHATALFVVYSVEAPGGTWDGADNGIYTVTVAQGAVTDRPGNPVAATTYEVPVSLPMPEGGPDLTAEFAPRVDLPAALRPGAAGRTRVRVTNEGGEVASGRVRVRLLARETSGAGAAADAGGVEVATTPDLVLRLRPGASRVIPFRFNYPQAAGVYALVAQVDVGNGVRESNEANNTTQDARAVVVAAPFARLTPARLGAPRGGVIPVGGRLVVPVTVRNDGNALFSGDVNVELFGMQAGATFPHFAWLGQGPVTRRLKLRPGASRVLRVSVLISDVLPPGDYTLKANVNAAPANAVDPEDVNNSVTSTGTIAAR